MSKLLAGATVLALVLLPVSAEAAGMNNPPPAGPVILDLAGTPIPKTYTQYTTSFVATSSITDLSFAFRDDPAFLSLDDVSVTTGGGTNIVVNGGFESGPLGAQAPAGWTYLNVYNAGASGVVSNNNPHTGSNNYYDGSVQAYDAITQQLMTTQGSVYTVSFFLDENSGQLTFQPVSTNGDTTDPGGNGIDLLVYAGNGVPVPAGAPAPLAGAGLLSFFGAGGIAMRKRAKRVVGSLLSRRMATA